MLNDLLMWGLAALSLFTALTAGVFFAFSDFMMRSLSTAPAAVAAEAMQVINREIYGSVFVRMLIGMIPVSAALILCAGLILSGPAAILAAMAGAVYLVGVTGVTAARNIPMNQRLDSMPDGGAQAASYWPAYAARWTAWNHVRTGAATVAAACLAGAALSLALTA